MDAILNCIVYSLQPDVILIIFLNCVPTTEKNTYTSKNFAILPIIALKWIPQPKPHTPIVACLLVKFISQPQSIIHIWLETNVGKSNSGRTGPGGGKQIQNSCHPL